MSVVPSPFNDKGKRLPSELTCAVSLGKKKNVFPNSAVPLFRLALTPVCVCLCASVHTLHLLVTLESLLRHELKALTAAV